MRAATLLAVLLVKPLSDFFHFPRTSLMLMALAYALVGLWAAFATALCQGLGWFKRLAFIGVLTMLLNQRSKRLGDFASGTIVVREGSRVPVAMPLLSAPGEMRGFELSNQDATLVRDFLLRRGGMNPRARADLAQRLATSLAQRYSLPLESAPEAFLERLTSS